MPQQKILIIDDSTSIHRLVEHGIKDIGADLLFACDGQSGLVLANQEQPDLILLDVNMPNLSGFEVCSLLKDNPETYDISVIFLTGDSQSLNMVKGFDLGAIDYVTKPFDKAELTARVRAALKTKTLLDLLTSQAQIDGLTGLHNRRYFDEQLAQKMAECHRYNQCVGLLLLDVDHFKKINDQLGHPKGDQALTKLAQVISNTCRTSDIACRYGGEEFALILPQSDQPFTLHCGQRLLQTVRDCPDFKRILGQSLTISIGSACAPPCDTRTPSSLVQEADKALYAAKQSGRDRVMAA